MLTQHIRLYPNPNPSGPPFKVPAWSRTEFEDTPDLAD